MEKLFIVGLGIAVLFILFFIISIIRGMSSKGIEKTLTRMGTIAAKAQKNILMNNEQYLIYSANKQADINKDAIKTTVHAIKEGLTKDEIKYCKHCGASIDADSKFCKSCGKEQ